MTTGSNFKDDGLTLADFMPNDAGKAGQSYQAIRGDVLGPDEPKASKKDLAEAIQTVYDPELPVNLWDLGLIYRLEQLTDGNIEVDMTLTAPGCPVAGDMPDMVAGALSAVPGTGQVTVTLVWEPAWSKERMSEDARLLLDV